MNVGELRERLVGVDDRLPVVLFSDNGYIHDDVDQAFVASPHEVYAEDRIVGAPPKVFAVRNHLERPV